MSLSQDYSCQNSEKLEPISVFFQRDASTVVLLFDTDLDVGVDKEDFRINYSREETESNNNTGSNNQEDNTLNILSIEYVELYQSVEIRIEEPSQTIFRTKLTIEITKPDLIRQKDKPTVTLSNNTFHIDPFRYLVGDDEVIASSSRAVSSIFSFISIFSSVVSFKYPMQMNRLYQMFEYPLMLNLDHPRRMVIFLEWFNKGSLTHYLPNIFDRFTNHHCKPIGTKFKNVDYECQFLKNVGFNLLLILFIFCLKVIFELLIWIVKKIENYEEEKRKFRRSMSSIRIQRQSLKNIKSINQRTTARITRRQTLQKYQIITSTKTSKLSRAFSLLIDLKGVYYVISGTQLELFLSIFINLKYHKSGDRLANLNLVVATLILFLLLAWISLILIKNIQLVKSIESRDKVKRIKMKGFSFLIEDVHCKTHFGAYFNVYHMIKDMFLALLVVFLYDHPWLQISGTAILMVVLTFQQLRIKPLKCNLESFCRRVEISGFSVINVIFVFMTASDTKQNPHWLSNASGYPLIILLVVIIVSSTVPALNSIRVFLRDTCCGSKAPKRRRFKLQGSGYNFSQKREKEKVREFRPAIENLTSLQSERINTEMLDLQNGNHSKIGKDQDSGMLVHEAATKFTRSRKSSKKSQQFWKDLKKARDEQRRTDLSSSEKEIKKLSPWKLRKFNENKIQEENEVLKKVQEKAQE